jgi:hypothetical protein
VAETPLDLLLQQSDGVTLNAYRYLAADLSEHRTPDEMREALAAMLGEVDTAGLLRAVAEDHATLDALGLTLAAEVAQADADLVRSAVSTAREALPVSDTEAIALVVAYALWLVTTRGRRRTLRIVRRTSDGATERIELTEWQSPGEGVDHVKRLLGEAALPEDEAEQ